MARTVQVVPHTHWDREWYAPFQTFRMRLLELGDALIELMESDPSYARYLFDGQAAALDDYLELRPENEGRLRNLAAAGRLSTGPWYILMDEFLVSGETIVRNLQLGIERAAAFGGAMNVGYLPDMFGHIAQMPQLLRLAGLEHAVVWRGVPAAIDRDAFRWISPDGSAVRAQYLVTGYSEGSALRDDVPALLERVGGFVKSYEPWFTGPVLYPAGTDHERPQHHLGSLIERANAAQDELHFEIVSLPEALAGRTTDDLPSWTGELRSGARANLLMGVASNRVDVKQQAARTERALEQLAEPLATLLLAEQCYPSRELAHAWREVVRNSAHDSICACSHDEVVVAVLHRYHEARQIADAVTERALAALRDGLAVAGTVAFNPTPQQRGGTVELVIPAAEAPPGAQRVSGSAGLDTELSLSATEVRSILAQIDATSGFKIGEDGYVTKVEIESGPEAIEVAIGVGTTKSEAVDVESAKRELLTRLEERPQSSVRVRLDVAAHATVLARVVALPGYSWREIALVEPASPVRGAIEADGSITLKSPECVVIIDPGSGTFSVDGLAGFDRLVDGGDAGDTYNYSPPEHDEIVEEPEQVTLRLLESGPVRAAAEVTRRYRWPERLAPGGRTRSGSVTATVVTRLELHADERFVRVQATIVNPARDHRLRAHFPLPAPATHSVAESAFDSVERGLEAEGGPSERGLATYPSRRHVSAGGLVVAHEGVSEYELTAIGPDGATELALTLLRATGMLSRLTSAYRPLPAGPTTPLEGPQLQGSLSVRYAVSTAPIDGYRLVDDAFLPILVVPSLGGGTAPSEGQLLEVSGAEVSSLRRTAAGHIELRVFNPGGTTTELAVSLPAPAGHPAAGRSPVSGRVVNLLGDDLGPFRPPVALGPHQILTVRIDPSTASSLAATAPASRAR
jgi:mannosylglycerate hydrolase